MPSRLSANRTALTRARRQLGVQQTARQVLATTGPWGGYVPNLEAALRTPNAAKDIVGLISIGEELTHDYGWRRSQDEDETNPLPLGAAGAGFPAATGLPIVLMRLFIRNPGQTEENIAVTQEDGATGAIYRFPITGSAVWEEVTFNGSAAIVAKKTDVPDATVYSPADRFIYTNNVDDIYMYPSIASAADYEELPTPTSLPNLTNLKARSVTTFAERLLILNVSRNAVRFPRELRWTELGWSTPDATNWQNVGSGALEWREFIGEGVKILPITLRRCVCYFSDGVGFLDTTGLPTRPFQRDVVTRERGLLGPQAAVDLGNGVHFGIFTDGWYILDASGRFQEAGTVDVGGVQHRKWADDFYRRLNTEKRDRVVVGYDPERLLVYVSWPNASSNADGDPNELWIYDVKGDRVFRDDYSSGFAEDHTPTSFARYRQVVRTATTYDELTRVPPYPAARTSGATYDELIGTTYDDLGASLGRRVFAHGTVGGLVFEHDPTLVLRDSVRPSWSYLTHANHFGDPAQWKTYQRVYVEYRQTTASQNLFIDLIDGTSPNLTVASELVVLDGANANGVYTDYQDFHRAVLHAQIRIRGSHPTTLKSFREEILPSGGNVIEQTT